MLLQPHVSSSALLYSVCHSIFPPPQVKSPGSPESARVLALLCLGEVGRSGSLGGSKEVQGVILEAFTSTSEEVRHTGKTQTSWKFQLSFFVLF